MIASGALDKDEGQATKVDKCYWGASKYRVTIRPVAQLMKGVFIIDVFVPSGQQPNGFAQWREPPTGQCQGQAGAYDATGLNIGDVLYAT